MRRIGPSGAHRVPGRNAVALHDEFAALKATVRKTIILVTHDMREAFKLGDRIALMDAGEIVQIGSAADFRARPASRFVETFLRSHLGETGHAG